MKIGLLSPTASMCYAYTSRIAKMSARKRISEFSGVTPRGRKGKEETAEESDDSLIGEHSPFVRQPVKRCGTQK